MKTIVNVLSAGALALAVTTADVGTAEARGRGTGVLIGLGAGLLIGGLLAGHARSHPRVYYQTYEPVTCYPGPTRCRWERVCDDNGYGDFYCQKVQHCFRPQICE